MLRALYDNMVLPGVTLAGGVGLGVMWGLFDEGADSAQRIIAQDARMHAMIVTARVDDQVGFLDSADKKFALQLSELAMLFQKVSLVGLGRGALYLFGSFFAPAEGGASREEDGVARGATGVVVRVAGILSGILLMGVFAWFIIGSGLHVFDPIMRLVVGLALLPVAVAALPFDGLRARISVPLARLMGYCAMLLLIVGIMYATVASILIRIIMQSLDGMQGYRALAAFVSESIQESSQEAARVAAVRALGAAGDGLYALNLVEVVSLVVAALVGLALLEVGASMAGGLVGFSADESVARSIGRSMTQARQQMAGMGGSLVASGAGTLLGTLRGSRTVLKFAGTRGLSRVAMGKTVDAAAGKAIAGTATKMASRMVFRR